MYASRDADPADESIRVQNIVVVATRHDQTNDQAGLLVGLEQRQVLRSTHLHGNRAEGIDNRGSKRHEGQRRWYFGVEYVVFTLGRRHPVPL